MISFNKLRNGMASLMAVESAMYSLSVTLRAISVCNLLLHIIGHPANMITKPVQERRDSGEL